MLRGRQGGLPLAAEWAIYLAAAAIYIGVGFVRKEVFAWWTYGAIWFVGCAWFVPTAVDRVLNRRRESTGRDDQAVPAGAEGPEPPAP